MRRIAIVATACAGACIAGVALAQPGSGSAAAPIAPAEGSNASVLEPPMRPPTAEEVMPAIMASGGIGGGSGKSIEWQLWAESPPNADGRHLAVRWKRDRVVPKTKLLVLRRKVTREWVATEDHLYVGQNQTPILSAEFLYPSDPKGGERKPVDASTLSAGAGTAWGEWTVIGLSEDKDGELTDEVEAGGRYVYALAPVLADETPVVQFFIGQAALTPPATPHGFLLDNSKLFFLVFVVMTGAAFLIYIQLAKRRGKDMFIRRIPGVDAIEDAVGRSTEMGRPVLYVTGIEEITDIQTIASLLILGHVAEMTAEYDTEIKVANTYPMTMVVAEEIVRNSYTNVGRADAHRPENIMFITSEQFAFAAAVNGMILRDRPATNIFFGRFFAESLMLSETGFMVGAVQIAGTAEFTQLPFFVASCDYTLIGEELYAIGAYLSREPNQIAQIKAGDVMKVVVVLLVLAGTVLATASHYDLIGKLIP